MSDDKDIKVTDKRMFTPEGELRDEYRFLEEERPPGAAEKATAEQQRSQPAEQPAEPAAQAPQPAASGGAEAAPAATPERPPLEIPGTPPGLGAPTFFDLVSVLAEPVALYLGDAELPDGRSLEDLDMARLHIDLLDVLRQKTAGNLGSQESVFLEDLLYRLRMRYVQKRG